jgi:hypothetical protein
MWLIYVNWVVYLGGLFYLIGVGNLLVAAIWVLLLPLGMRAYLRLFPTVSVYLGFGDVSDKRSRRMTYPQVKANVQFYTAGGCPFCPLVEERLERLRRLMGFDLETIHVTYRPELLARGIGAVPVVDVEGRRLVGNVTTDQLIAFIAGSQAEPAA